MTNFIIPSKKETLWGSVYLLLHLTVLPHLVNLVLSLFTLSNAWNNLIYTLLQVGLSIVILHRYLWDSLRQAPKQAGSTLGYALAGLGIHLLLTWLLNTVIIAMGFLQVNLNNTTVIDMVQKDFWPMAICTVVLIPVAEEVLYRSILFGGLYVRGRLISYAVSMAVFSAIHVIPYLSQYDFATACVNFLTYLPAGFALAWSYEKSGNILTPILIHCAVNTMGLLSLR